MRFENIIQLLFRLAAVFTTLGSIQTAKATDYNVLIIGFLITPPICSINNDTQFELDFKNMNIENIDGIQYRQPLNYRVTCESTPTNGRLGLTLTLKGRPAAFSETNSAILSNKPNLAIQIFQDNQPFILDVPINISLSKIPVLEAVPIKAPNVNLTEGPFEAYATLQAEYQ